VISSRDACSLEKAVAGKVERRALLAQMDDAGLFPVDLHPQPAPDLFADEPPQFAGRVLDVQLA